MNRMKFKLNMANEIGYMSSALDYSRPVPRYINMGDAKFVKHTPVNAFLNVNDLTFVIPPTEDFIDLQECYLNVGVKITKQNGEDLEAADRVCFTDNVLGSLFKSVSTTLNKERITKSNVYQTFENFFVTRFGVSRSATDIHLKVLQGLCPEKPGKHDNATGEGRVERQKWTALSKQARFIGPIPCDFLRSCSNFLPPLQELGIHFELNDPNVALVASTAGPYAFKLTDITLYTRQVPIAANTTVDIQKMQLTKPLKLNYTSIEVQSYSIPANSTAEYIRGIFPHQKPSQLFMILIETDRLHGVLAKDTFKFEHGFVERAALKLNGSAGMVDEIKTDFTANADDAKEAYFYALQSFNVGFNGRDINLEYKDFIGGSTMWAWTLAPDMDANNGVGLLQTTTSLDVNINVKAGTTNPALTALFVGKFNKSVQIGENNKTTAV